MPISMMASDIEDIYELSPVQQGMLFHSLSAATPEAQFQQLSWTLRGALDRAAFEWAWQRLVDQQPVLRTLFLWKDLEKPVQVVRRQVRLSPHYEDWRGMPPPEQRRLLDRFLHEDRARGFELATAPLMRLALI